LSIPGERGRLVGEAISSLFRSSSQLAGSQGMA